MNPTWPLYIVSKGRWESRLTAKSLEAMNVPYRIIVEEQEYTAYAEVIAKEKILVLDKAYQRDYDTFSDDPSMGGGKGTGSGPARNFAWDHSLSIGAAWHWVMDDNIRGFWRFNHNRKIRLGDGTGFRAMEDWAARYRNIAMAGPQYFMFVWRKNGSVPPIILNTRIYSCNLIRNSVPFRWRGRYNEDTDLSLRMLKGGWATALFNGFLQNKAATLTLKGGNTDTVYKGGTLPKSRMIVAMHPDVARLTKKYGRWHHEVDYTPFKGTRLIRDLNIAIPPGVNNYGLELIDLSGEASNAVPTGA